MELCSSCTLIVIAADVHLYLCFAQIVSSTLSFHCRYKRSFVFFYTFFQKPSHGCRTAIYRQKNTIALIDAPKTSLLKWWVHRQKYDNNFYSWLICLSHLPKEKNIYMFSLFTASQNNLNYLSGFWLSCGQISDIKYGNLKLWELVMIISLTFYIQIFLLKNYTVW